MKKDYEITIKNKQGAIVFHIKLDKEDLEIKNDGVIVINSGLRLEKQEVK